MWNSITNISDPEPEKDIVERLLEADQQQRKTLEGAMVIGAPPSKSIFLEAAEQIIALRNVLRMTEN